jgi:hypothetical protein
VRLGRRTLLAAPLAAAGPAAADPGLLAAGWRATDYHGLPPARWSAIPNGVAVEAAAGQGSFVWRPVQGAARCLAWRWRVDAGPGPTDLTRRGGDDRALAVAVGFAGWPPRASAWTRAQHAVAQAQAGGHTLPRSVLLYVWGGTGREPPRFYSPWMSGLGQVRVLRPADSPRGQWFEERVDLALHWRESFGAEPPPLQEIALGTDVDDTPARVSARVEAIGFGGC